MKLLLIHSDGAKMEKKALATSHPGWGPDSLNLTKKVLVCYVSVEDQDTFDIDIIADEAVQEIKNVIELIEGFPQKIEDQNKDIKKLNDGLERKRQAALKNPKIKIGKDDKPREYKKLILDPSMYKVDQILVYPWAHLSKFLSQESTAKDVVPKIAEKLKSMEYETYYSAFGYYKSFEIHCLGHEVAELYRDVPLAVTSDEVRATSKFYIVNPDQSVEHFCDSNEESKKKAKIPKRFDRDFQDFIKAEILKGRSQGKREPEHIRLMQRFEIADFDDATDAGNFRWYTNGMIMKNVLREYVEQKVINLGGILVDTPLMYTVKNKKLTAQTARFPAKSYWVHSGSDRFLLRFASDFLLFNMFSQMNIRADQLPIRAYEYEQYAFRRELAGELAGFRRLRAFTMPDLHSLCKDLDQSVIEFKKQISSINTILNDVGVKSYSVIRTTEEFWEENKEWIIKLITEDGEPALVELWPERYYYFILKYERPVLSAQGHSACLSTNQIDVESALDFVEQYGKTRQKYDITWQEKDGTKGHPIILHCSPSGAIERVIWAILETNARYKDQRVPGFPTWLSPVQARILSVSEDDNNYAEEIMQKLNLSQIRCDFDDRDETVGKKIRSAEVEWIPYTIIVGDKERTNNTVSIRKRLTGEEMNGGNTSEQMNDIPLDQLIEIINKDLAGFPRRTLPIPFRRYSTRILFRQ